MQKTEPKTVKEKTKKTKPNALITLCFSALFAAIIAVATAFIKVNTASDEGYLHFGDSMIYLASCVLPLPYAMLASAVGGFLADLIAGVPMWAPFTAVIKAFNAVPFALLYCSKRYKKKDKILTGATVGMSVASGLVTIVGYFLATWTLLSLESAVVGMPTCWIQPLGSAIVFYIVAAALDAAKFKTRVNRLLYKTKNKPSSFI